MAQGPLDVVVIGNVGIDTNIYLHGADIDWTVEANFTENLDYVGQAGGYASRGYARLGHATAFIGTVGDDYHGQFIREELGRDGIDLSGLFIDPKGTARSINLMYRDGRRKNFYDGKGHMALEPNLPACRAVLARAKLAHFNIPNWARRLLPLARELGVKIAVDLQDIVSSEDLYHHDFVENVDYLFFSAANQADPLSLMRSFLGKIPDQVIVCGMGSDGCALGSRAGIARFGPVDLGEPVVDTNGAGDALAVGFLSSYIFGGYSLEDAVLRGQIAARHTCAQRATSSTLITADLLDRNYRSLRLR